MASHLTSGWGHSKMAYCMYLITYKNKKERRGVTVNYLYNGHCRDLGLVSSLVGVLNSGMSNVCNLFFLGFSTRPYYRNFRYSGRGCPQDES